jgi:hypothetical protein
MLSGLAGGYSFRLWRCSGAQFPPLGPPHLDAKPPLAYLIDF